MKPPELLKLRILKLHRLLLKDACINFSERTDLLPCLERGLSSSGETAHTRPSSSAGFLGDGHKIGCQQRQIVIWPSW